MERQWIGIVGRNGSGKSSVCEYLQTKGFTVVSLSDVVRYHAKKDGLPDDRNSLTSLANSLKEARGLAYFAEASMAHAKDDRLVAFDSIRHPKEVELLRDSGVILIGIYADLRDCYERIKARGKGTDFVSFEEFKAQDVYEMSGQSKGQQIAACLELCDVQIENKEGLGNLFAAVDDILEMFAKDQYV